MVFSVIAIQIDFLGEILGEGGGGLEAAAVDGYEREARSGDDGWLVGRGIRELDGAMDCEGL